MRPAEPGGLILLAGWVQTSRRAKASPSGKTPNSCCCWAEGLFSLYGRDHRLGCNLRCMVPDAALLCTKDQTFPCSQSR